MKPSNGVFAALFLLATCSEEAREPESGNVESAKLALGIVPPTEIAVWQKVGGSSTPDGRYLQAAAFDEVRKVVVMFGGTNTNPSTGMVAPNQETWIWSPVTGKWTRLTGAGSAPDARSGASMVYDSLRGKFVLFGGRAGSGFNLEDTWEWDPTTGVWTNMSAAGAHPSARSQHGMVYEKSTGKILLFGGGRSDSASYDGSGVSISLGDTWEYEPVAHVWTQLAVTGAPSVRHDFGMAWDSTRNVALLFGGLQTDIASVPGVPKQDTWEWNPATSTWTERTAAGNKPSQRYAHAMAFDGSRGKAVVFGGWDIGTGGSRNDLWEWDPTTGAWTERLMGTEIGVPGPRMYASLVSDDASARLELVAGEMTYNPYGGTGGYYGSGGSAGGTVPPVPIGIGYGATGSRDVWELNPVTPAFTNRTAPLDIPASRYSQAMAYNPATGKTCIFGGYDAMSGQLLDDLWEWDGKTWAQVAVDVRPPARSDAAMAYDPARKSLILFGGNNNSGTGTPYNDTWEFGSSRKWTQLSPASSPDPLMGHGMVTDTTRNKILLFGGQSSYMWLDFGPYKDPTRNEVWEWDGATTTWTNRTPTTSAPVARTYPLMSYDEGRQKLFLFDGASYGNSPTQFWEWDPISAGWATRMSGDTLAYAPSVALTYDSSRRREVLLMDPYGSSTGVQETWELDARAPTFYVRALAGSPGSLYGGSMAFDSARGVAVLFGNSQSSTTGSISGETWEYKVSNLGNGEGCTATSATTCASGYCVDGVCCDTAACTGACKSCNVAGSEGTCVSAKAGTEVAGSCAVGQSCDGSGSCKTKNGQACASAAACASGFCADGVCCDGACTGTCASCNLAGRVGKCSPYAAGSDPQGECGKGTGVCKSTCDGVGSCAYPQATVTCATCTTCDGMGTCSNYDYYCGSYGGSYGGSGGNNYGGSYGGGAGGMPGFGGSGGSAPSRGGSGGGVPSFGGSGGALPNAGGSGGGIPGYGGSIGSDGGPGDAGTSTKLGHSSCICGLGHARPGNPGLTAPFLIAGAALLLVRKRRRKT